MRGVSHEDLPPPYLLQGNAGAEGQRGAGASVAADKERSMTTKVKIDAARWREVKDRPLLVGSHSPDGQMCVMELAAYIAHEPWSDHPECVSPVLGAFLRAWNDALDDGTRQKLKPYARKAIGTAGGRDADERRAWMATDWLVRVWAPTFLRLAKLDAEADALVGLPELVDTKTAREVQPAIRKARTKAAAAGDAARAAAWDASWAAAWDAARAAARAAAWAAAWDASWAAAWDASWAAARAAAWDASWGAARAAAWDAARAAAWAALEPAVTELQDSAFELLDRMVAA